MAAMERGHLCFRTRNHEIMRTLDNKGVVRLLRADVKRAGGQSSWARREGIDRTILNKVLRGWKPPTGEIIKALKLCNVYEPDDDALPAGSPKPPPSHR
jgi:hypothetical protein